MSSDEQLKTAVLDELAWEPSVDQAHIGVAAHDGVITLSGSVGSFAEKRGAEHAAQRVRGVKAVAETIDVRLPFDSQRGDDQIAAAAADRLAWDPSAPDSIKVKVEGGWVTLAGEVQWYYQKHAALDDVRNLFGVVGVNDEMTIRPTVDTSRLGHDIMKALHRSWFFDPSIQVTAEGGKVHLTGSVASPHERQVAAITAWAATGATSVQNDIRLI